MKDMRTNACKGCRDRCAEPSCRLTCEKWKNHEAKQAAEYEKRKRLREYEYINRAKERAIRKMLNERRGK